MQFLGGLDEDVHRAFGMPTCRLADDAGRDLVGAGKLQVEQSHRAGLVQPVDVVLHVLGRILATWIPETEYSSSRRFVTTVWRIAN